MPLYHLLFFFFLHLLNSPYLDPQFFSHFCSSSSIPYTARGKAGGAGVGNEQVAGGCLVVGCGQLTTKTKPKIMLMVPFQITSAITEV